MTKEEFTNPMKKAVALILSALLMLTSLFACDEPTETGTTNSQTKQELTVTSASAPATEGTAD